MSEKKETLTVKMDVDMSGFNKSIDVMNERLSKLKAQITIANKSIVSQTASPISSTDQNSSAFFDGAKNIDTADSVLSGLINNDSGQSNMASPSSNMSVAIGGTAFFDTQNGKTSDKVFEPVKDPNEKTEMIRREVERILSGQAATIAK